MAADRRDGRVGASGPHATRCRLVSDRLERHAARSVPPDGPSPAWAVRPAGSSSFVMPDIRRAAPSDRLPQRRPPGRRARVRSMGTAPKPHADTRRAARRPPRLHCKRFGVAKRHPRCVGSLQTCSLRHFAFFRNERKVQDQVCSTATFTRGRDSRSKIAMVRVPLAKPALAATVARRYQRGQGDSNAFCRCRSMR